MDRHTHRHTDSMKTLPSGNNAHIFEPLNEHTFEPKIRLISLRFNYAKPRLEHFIRQNEFIS